jgi:hypothetical protein
VGTQSLTVTKGGAVSEKSTWNALDYAAMSSMARHRAVLRWLMQLRFVNSLPSSTISAVQSWKKKIQ